MKAGKGPGMASVLRREWGLRWGLGLVLVMQVALLSSSSPKVEAAECFNSVFAFGDGLFDTGSISAVFPSLLNYDYLPYGSTHFGKPSGRFSDGRLVLDFISEALGLPKVHSYAQTVSSDFSTGVSFGSAFSTIGTVSTGQTAGPFMFLNPFSLPMQLRQFTEFKFTTGLVHASKTIPNTKRILQEEETTEDPEETGKVQDDAHAKARLPANAEFSSGLYLVAAGRHDIVNFFNMNFTVEQIEGKLADLLSQYSSPIRAEVYSIDQGNAGRLRALGPGREFPIPDACIMAISAPGQMNIVGHELWELHKSLAKNHGANNIIVFDVEPLGCQPFLLTLLPHTDADLDAKGCLIKVNALIQSFNKQLKKSVKSWRSSYKSNIVYVSLYDITINLITDSESGFNVTNIACCGVPTSPYNVNILVPCGPPGIDITTNPPSPLQASSCSSRNSYLYWDGFYATEAANKYITEKIVSGDYFDIPFEGFTACAQNQLS